VKKPRERVALLVVPALLLAACAGGGAGNAKVSNSGGRTASDVGVTADTITIGTHIPLTGPVATSGIRLKPAFDAYVKYVNDNGGVNGRQLILKIEDDAYAAPQTLSVVRKLVEQDKVFAIFHGYGTTPVKAAFDYLTEQKVPDMNMYTGTPVFSQPPQKYHFGLLPTYDQEGVVYADYVKKAYPGAKVALLYQNDDFGKAYKVALERNLGRDIVVEKSYETTDVDVMSQVSAMAKTRAEVAMCVCIFKPLAQFLKESHAMGWDPHSLAVQGVVNDTLVQNVGKDLAEGVVADAFQPPSISSDPKVLALKDILAKYGGKDTVFDDNALIGLVSIELMVSMLRESGTNPTRESLLQAATTKTYEGTWYGKVQMTDQNHVALSCHKMVKMENAVVTPFGDVVCKS
jgi:ABC-type branched-subunit amino acid transport system substrate-binding protein